MTSLLKTCSKCDEAKPLDQFHKDANKVDGKSPWCKPCKNGRSLDLIRKRLQDPTSLPSIRQKIYAKVAQALANGTLVKPDACPVCKAKVDPSELQGHHHDYDKPLDVE